MPVGLVAAGHLDQLEHRRRGEADPSDEAARPARRGRASTRPICWQYPRTASVIPRQPAQLSPRGGVIRRPRPTTRRRNPAHQPPAMTRMSPVAAVEPATDRTDAGLHRQGPAARPASRCRTNRADNLAPRNQGSMAAPCSHQRAKTTPMGTNRAERKDRSATAGSAVPAPPSVAQRKPITNRQANPYSTLGECPECV